MAGVALLDVNVLIALFDPGHIHHDLAHDWFADHRDNGWATCPITEGGLVRVLANPKFLAEPLRPAEAVKQLERFCASGHHHYWADQVSLRDEKLFALGAMRGHRQVTDVYLLGLARRMDGTLATFDRSIPISSVRGATNKNLTVIAP